MLRLRFLTSAFIIALTLSLAASAQQLSDQEIESRVNDLLQKMTIEEKVGQLTQFPDASPHTMDLIRQGKVGSLLGVLGVKDTNEAQKAALQSRLKIPLILGYDVIHGYRTIFPVPLASAGSFAKSSSHNAGLSA